MTLSGHPPSVEFSTVLFSYFFTGSLTLLTLQGTGAAAQHTNPPEKLTYFAVARPRLLLAPVAQPPGNNSRYIFFSVSLPGCCLGYVHKADSELLCNVCMAVLDNRTTILPITASLMCTGADHYFRPSKPHSGKLCNVSFRLRSNSP